MEEFFSPSEEADSFWEDARDILAAWEGGAAGKEGLMAAQVYATLGLSYELRAIGRRLSSLPAVKLESNDGG